MAASRRRICIFTSTRADYGLLRNLIRETEAHPDALLQLVVSGTHLSPEHGYTVSEIAEDGFDSAATIPIWSGDDSNVATAADVGTATGAYAESLATLNPDVVVVLGDRLEAFAMATAATIMNFPIAHIHGGELTEGAMDDALRHAITKLSYLHFASTAEHQARLIQLGEAPERVMNLGAPVVDALAQLSLLSDEEIAVNFGITVSRPTALVTFHPALLDAVPSEILVGRLLQALINVDGLGIIITGTNSDIGSIAVRSAISAFVDENPGRVHYRESFGQRGYLSVMSRCAVVVGNSSSTVLEAPILGTPSVLVGNRQKGRPQGGSVLLPRPETVAIEEAIRYAMSANFAAKFAGQASPFGKPGFAERALSALLNEDFPRPLTKTFWDLEKDKK